MPKYITQYVFVFSFSALLLVAQASANPYRTEIHGDTAALKIIANEIHDGVDRVASPKLELPKKSMRFSASITGAGRFDIFLNKVDLKSWKSSIQNAFGITQSDKKDIALVKGYARVNGQRLSVGGSIYREKANELPALHLIMNSIRGKGRALYLKARIQGSIFKNAKVSSVPAARLHSLACGNNEPHVASETQGDATTNTTNNNVDGGVPNTSAAVTGIDPSNHQIAIVATEFDPAWYASYGENSNAHIATLIAAASAIYERQLGIRLVIGTQHGFSSSTNNPYNSTDSGTLLSLFRSYTATNNQLGDADLYHLFSGQNFDGGIIGLAWVGVTCNIQAYSFGITQKFNPTADASIVAHEMGHNLGANHDTVDSLSLMAPVVNIPGSTYFSATSVQEIKTHLDSVQNCFDPDSNPGGGSGGASPTPTPTATPDPGNNNGSFAPNVSLRTSLTNAGALGFRITLDSIQSGCEVVLSGSTRNGGSGSSIYRFTPTSVVTTLQLAGLRDPRARNSNLYFNASYVCAADTATSGNVRVGLDSITKKTSQSVSAVLSSIKNAFAALKKKSIRR